MIHNSMMHVVVTGAAGFSGRHVTRALLDAGCAVTAHVGRNRDRISLSGRDYPNLKAVAGDLTAELSLPERCDAIVHTAARSPPAPDHELVHSNVTATANLLAYARRSGARTFVYFSSLSIYGSIRDPIVNEATAIIDPDAYGATKYTGETMLRDAKGAMRSLSLRLPGLIGPGSARNWLSGVLAKARAGQRIEFYRPEAPFNNAVHVDDLCRLVVACVIRRDWHGHDAVTLGAGGMTTVRGAVEIIAAGCGSKAPLTAVEGQQSGFTISSAHARRVYGYAPMDIEAMLQQFVEENR